MEGPSVVEVMDEDDDPWLKQDGDLGAEVLSLSQPDPAFFLCHGASTGHSYLLGYSTT